MSSHRHGTGINRIRMDTVNEMRVCLQRVKKASVMLRQTDEIAGQIGPGLLVLLGVGAGDTDRDALVLAKQCAELRIFEDEAGKMNLSLLDMGGSMLIVSQFTLYADCRKGRRPSFIAAAPPVEAERQYRFFVDAVREKGIKVETGVFQSEMEVALINDGPVTIWLDTAQLTTS